MHHLNTSKQAFLIGVAVLTLTCSAGLMAVDIPPARCANYGNLQSISLADWEAGLGSWTAGTHDVADPGVFSTPDWASVGNLPANQAGKAAYVANLDIGDCGADDQAGALSLDSPSILIPVNTGVPRISFEHWFETELEYDGGNLKISVNGGAFTIIPASAFEYGESYDTLAPAFDDIGLEDNTNPLAGQEAFTGTVDGNPTGSWSDVRINLLGIAAGGDTIKLRFDFGIDGCDGAVGWYVDDVEVYSCAAELPPSDCGNGKLDQGEQCDDGNDFVNDGCSNTCQVENGWECTVPGSPGSISDPSFEAGTPNPFWAEVSNNTIGTPICEVAVCGRAGGTGPSDGDFWVFLGGVKPSQEGSVSQSVVIPSSVSTLSFDLEIPICDSVDDYMDVLIDGNRELIINGSDPRCGVDGYMTQTVNISAYADGQSHDIEFHSETFSNNGGTSNFFIDVIALPGKPSMCTTVTSNTSLTLVKKVINDDGGSAIPANWTLTASGPTGFSGAGPSVSSGEGFAAGTYNLSEGGGPAGYSASSWDCVGGNQVDGDTVMLGQGESATCTITNDDVFSSGVQINAGMNDAWYNPDTAGQGFFVTVFPDIKKIFLAWFTYEVARPPESVTAVLGEPGHRWLTAFGSYSGSQALLDIEVTEGGLFDSSQPAPTQSMDGTILLEFSTCNSGTVTFDIPSIDSIDVIPIERIAVDNVPICEMLNTQ